MKASQDQHEERGVRVPEHENQIRPQRFGLARITVVVLATILAHGIASRANAQWHLDIQAGAFSPISDVEFEVDGFEEDIDLDTGGAFTIGGGYALERWIDFTAQFQTATYFDLYDDAADVYSFTVGGRFFPLPMNMPVRPWLGAQIGWYHVEAYTDEFDFFDDDDDDEHEGDDSFGVNAGAGLDFPINHRVSLGVDVRYHNAFDAFQGFEYVATMFNVSIWFGPPPPAPHTVDTPPVPRGY
jgi:hypothetical protein